MHSTVTMVDAVKYLLSGSENSTPLKSAAGRMMVTAA
jgi:hypothetical protein